MKRREISNRPARPFVTINMAMTADGKIATASRSVSSFGSGADQKNMLRLRASADAVMAGARTVDSDAVSMGPGGAPYRRLRLRLGLAEYNLRVIVSRRASVNPEAEIFRHQFSRIIILCTEAAPRERVRLLERQAEVRICGGDEIEWHETLNWLRAIHGVKRLLCEGGGELNDGLFRAGVVDELRLTVCPLIFGGGPAPTICDGIGWNRLAGAAVLEYSSARRIGNEMLFTFRVKKRRGA